MPTTAIRKTAPMLLLERLHPGKHIQQIVRETCGRHDRLEGAAADLSVSLNTLRAWKRLFGIQEP